MNRLQNLSMKIAKLMEAAPNDRRLNAVLFVCRKAASEFPRLSSLLHQALSAPAPDASLQTQLEQLRDKLDDQYLDAQETAEEGGSTSDEALRFFSEARLAAAMVLAIPPLDSATACEALYEALMSLSDQGPAIRQLKLILT